MFLIIGRSSWLEEGFRKEGNVFVARRALFGRRSALPTAQPFGDSSRAVRPGNSVGERLWTKCSYVVVVAASFVVFFSLPFRRFCARASAFRAGGENGGGSPILISLAIARKVLSEGGGGGVCSGLTSFVAGLCADRLQFRPSETGRSYWALLLWEPPLLLGSAPCLKRVMRMTTPPSTRFTSAPSLPPMTRREEKGPGTAFLKLLLERKTRPGEQVRRTHCQLGRLCSV